MNILNNRPAQLVASLTLTLLAAWVAHAAPVPPDAGQTMRELQQLPELKDKKAVAPLRSDKAETVSAVSGSDNLRIDVKAIRVTGSSVFAAQDLEALVADLVGEHTLAELERGAARITAYYRGRGYLVARAYLPAQEIRDGAVVINVLEGIVGRQRINNQSRLSNERVNGYLSGSKSGDVLRAAPVDRALLLLSDTPGVGAARATLQPGASVGTSDIVIELDPSAPYVANIELDNYGNRYTGEYRLGAALALNSPFGAGDQFNLRSLGSDQGMSYARIAYQLPLGSGGLRAGAAYSDTRYRLGKEYAALLAHGAATSGSVYAVYPFIRSQASNLTGTLTWEEKKLNDRNDAFAISIDKRVQLVNLGLSGNYPDALAGGGLDSFDLSLASGTLGMDAVSLAADTASAQSNGSFTRFAYNLNRLQRLTDADTLSVVLAGQQASKNLNSSEKFSLGGAYGVRAYPQGEGSGDEGWLTNLELRHRFKDTLQGVVFYDAGSVSINRRPFAAGANTRSISGAGFGANASLANVQLKAHLAWRTSGGQPQSEPASASSNPRLWMQVSAAF